MKTDAPAAFFRLFQQRVKSGEMPCANFLSSLHPTENWR
jgi:hypothetical protein